MLKLKILSIGKSKEKWLEEALREYTKRLKPYMTIEWLWAKDNAQLIEWAQKEPLFICLDPAGCLFTSEQFAVFLEQLWEKNRSRLTIVIGGPEGLPPILIQRAQLISLSPLTFTHQMTRLILIEQIYRALEINRGSSYHK
jgi:23S rRNA (pseudouridine1915-N3)-methyltransferase